MTFLDLFFLASVLLGTILCGRIALSALRCRWETARRLSLFLGLFLAFYSAMLIGVALALPRRVYAPGERRCFDDWCATALNARVADGPIAASCRADEGSRTWVVTTEITSDAKRVRQRARDARAELEDEKGMRYRPCGTALTNGAGPAPSLSDSIGPGESFRVILPFRLPAAATPAGLVLHHGDVPGVVIIGTDQSFPHSPALQRLALERAR